MRRCGAGFPSRQEHASLQAAEEQERRDVLAAESHPEVQALHNLAVPKLEGADHLSAVNVIALPDLGEHGLER